MTILSLCIDLCFTVTIGNADLKCGTGDTDDRTLYVSEWGSKTQKSYRMIKNCCYTSYLT